MQLQYSSMQCTLMHWFSPKMASKLWKINALIFKFHTLCQGNKRWTVRCNMVPFTSGHFSIHLSVPCKGTVVWKWRSMGMRGKKVFFCVEAECGIWKSMHWFFYTFEAILGEIYALNYIALSYIAPALYNFSCLQK